MAAACNVSVIAEVTGLGKELSFIEKFSTTTPEKVMYNYDEIDTTEEALDVGQILADSGTVEFIIIKNLDSTNYVEIDCNYTASTFRANIYLAAGDVAMFKPSGTVYAKANTGAVLVEYVVIGKNAA